MTKRASSSKRNTKRKVYSTQKEPEIIKLAKKGKASGLLSKQTKLHQGKYVSRGTLKKVRELRGAIEKGYKAEPVSKKRARELEGLGLQVVQGYKVVRPPGATWKKRVLTGKEPAGVSRIQRGYLRRVALPSDVFTLRDFIRKYKQNPELINRMKEPDELFAFRIFGNSGYKPYLNIESLIFDLEIKYVGLLDRDDMFTPREDKITGFEIISFDADNIRSVIPSRDERDKGRKARRAARKGERRTSRTFSPFYEAYKIRVRERNAIKASQKRSKMSNAEKEAYKQKARDRARKSYLNRKPK